jgi:hypothetical protein
LRLERCELRSEKLHARLDALHRITGLRIAHRAVGQGEEEAGDACGEHAHAGLVLR